MFTNSWWLSLSCCRKVAKDSLVYEGVINGINLGMVWYIGPINVFPAFYPGRVEGLGSDPKGGKLAIIVFMYNRFWKVVITAPDLKCVWACVATNGTKQGGKPYMDTVLIVIVLILLGAWVVIARPVASIGVKTGFNGWVTEGECSHSLFTSSLEEKFLDDGVFDLAILDTTVPLLKIIHQIKNINFSFLTLSFPILLGMLICLLDFYSIKQINRLLSICFMNLNSGNESGSSDRFSET